MTYSSKEAQKRKRGFLDPRTKLGVMVVLALFVMGGLGGSQMKQIKSVLSLFPFVLLLLEKQWKSFAEGAAMLATGYGLLFSLPYLPGLLNYVALMCGGILTRFVVTVVMAKYLIRTTTVSEFISAMERMHISGKIIIPMSVMFRLFPAIVSEWKSIRQAMEMRGITLGASNFAKVVEYQMVPMMTSTVRIGEELSASALTRGLSPEGNRTNICVIGFRIQDIILLGICGGVIVYWLLETLGLYL